MIFGGEERFIRAGHALMLQLRRNCRDMLLVSGGFLFGCGLRGDAAAATVEAHAGRFIDDDGLFVDVGDRDTAEIVDRAIVGEHAIVPMTALVAQAGIAEAVIDAAVEADMRSPITGGPHVDAVAPAPIARRPQHTDGRRHDPRARNPKIAIRTAGPVAGSPDVTGGGNRRLRVDRQFRRRNIVADANNLRDGGDRMRKYRQRQCGRQANNRTKSPHVSSRESRFCRDSQDADYREIKARKDTPVPVRVS